MESGRQRLIGWFLWYLDCSLEELARRAGVHESSVRNWKKGKSVPRRANLAKLAEAAGLPMTFLDAVVLPGIAAVHRESLADDEVFRDLADAARSLGESVGGLGRSAVAELAATFEAEERSRERETAEAQCERLKSHEADDLWYLIETCPEFQTVELAERLIEESARAATRDGDRATLLARVAGRVAELAG